MKYCVEITGIGELALELLGNDILIIFNENAPPELAELSVLHTIQPLMEDVCPGDRFVISGHTYTVNAVGEEANYTLRELGHCTIKFGGDKEVLPGYIRVAETGKPDIVVGSTIEIH